MNLLDTKIVQVLSEPYKEYDKWWVKVLVNQGYWPHDYEDTIMVNTKEEAMDIRVGHLFLS